jgi:ribonuclease BN (tRNA processing enzyme)
MLTRRDVLACASTAAIGALVRVPDANSQPVAPNLGPNRLVLLGTKGGPSIRGYNPSPSANLIVYNGVPYVVDTGYGVTFKLVEAKFPLPSLRYIFITHHHSDHNAELGLLLENAWATGLSSSVSAYGPLGTKKMIQGFWSAYDIDIEARIAEGGRPDIRKLVTAYDYSEGAVMEIGGAKVSALRNVHGALDSFSLKFEFPGKTIVFSGDTGYYPPLGAFAKGADILVHEVMYMPAVEELARRFPDSPRLLTFLKANHTSADDVGRIATAAGVKKLVLNHFTPSDDPRLTEQVWADAVRQTFSGDLVVGRDLMEIKL